MQKRFIFTLIALFLGWIGIQEFVLGNNIRGVLGILFCWTRIPAIIAIIQIIRTLCSGSDEDVDMIYPNNKI
jgi:TM2 domain-containing membrane protein YozV